MSLEIIVKQNSIAENTGLKSGDFISKINGKEINDQIDFSYQISDEFLDIEGKTSSGFEYFTTVQRAYNKELGISVIPPKITQCKNKCVFCFIHQQPRKEKKMRRSLYVMDDDYRFSFSDGNFITLTNLKPHEWKRIYRLKLSPLYISVHSTDPVVRKNIIKHKKSGMIMKQLKRLVNHDISFHSQIVLCPGYNDGEDLDKTIKDLISLGPHMSGIAIVPSGLTKYRERLPDLKSWDKKMAIETIKQVKKWQDYCVEKYGETRVYMSDELYFLAEKKMPAYKTFDGFPYTEDGVGTTAFFYKKFNQLKRNIPKEISNKREVTIVCGEIAEKYLREAIDILNDVDNLKVNLIPVVNNFFGDGINVTGLLTVDDITKTLSGKKLGNELIIPEVIVRKEDHLFLDDYTVTELEGIVKTKIRICPMGAGNFIDACLGSVPINNKS